MVLVEPTYKPVKCPSNWVVGTVIIGLLSTMNLQEVQHMALQWAALRLHARFPIEFWRLRANPPATQLPGRGLKTCKGSLKSGVRLRLLRWFIVVRAILCCFSPVAVILFL